MIPFYLNEVLVNSQLVQGQSSGFVTAQDIHAGHFLYSSHSFSDRSLQEICLPLWVPVDQKNEVTECHSPTC